MPIAALANLIVQQTKEEIYDFALGIAESVGLNVSSWQPGDPTRSLYHVESELLATLETLVVNYIKSGFLDLAADLAKADSSASVWLKVLADQVYGVTVPEATYASTTTMVLTNNGGGFYPDIEPNELTFRSSLSGKTYHNTTGGTLNSGPGTTLTLTIEADEAGSESSAGAGEIDEMVTTLLGVTCSNTAAAVGQDEQDPDTTVQQCRDKLGSFSVEGPKEAYSFVAKDPSRTGTNGITRSRVFSDSDTGDVTVILAGPSGPISGPDLALAEIAIAKWATPLCITPTVESASGVAQGITYRLWIYKAVNMTVAEIEATVQSALETMIRTRPIGGDIIEPDTTGKLYRDLIRTTIARAFAPGLAFRVEVDLPATDPGLANNEVTTLGTVTATVTLVTDP